MDIYRKGENRKTGKSPILSKAIELIKKYSMHIECPRYLMPVFFNQINQ